MRLVEELKSRAKGCITSRNFPVAVQLYSKAIEVAPTEDTAGAAILRANRSMCYLSMGNGSSALSDAEEAEKLDATYVKVYYRKAAALKALNRFGDAKTAVLKGLELKSDDKDMRALLAKLESDIASHGAVKVAPTVPAARSTVTTSGTSSATKAAQPPSAKPSSSAKSQGSAVVEGDEDDEDVALGNIRGYKKTADGRTTTFFNNELDETAKRLIGDIAPKKLDAAQEAKPLDSAALANGSSVWNSAGTYEERLLTPWATSELRQRLSAIAGRVEEGGAAMDAREWASFAGTSSLESVEVCVTEVESVTGDAQVSMIRGKKKHLCDYCVELKWALTLKHSGNASTEVVAGKLSVLDITADREYEISALEVTHFNGQAAAQSVLPLYAGLLFNAFVKKSSSAQPKGLQRLIHDAIMRFCDDLKTK